jgi:hypothetical protein
MQTGVPINPVEKLFSITDHAMHSLCQRICRALRLPPATPHGMRATFRTWGSAVRQDTVLIEAALSHAIGNDVYRAYDRREKHCNLLDHRWPVMRAWCDFVGKPYSAPAKPTKPVSNVVPFLRVASWERTNILVYVLVGRRPGVLFRRNKRVGSRHSRQRAPRKAMTFVRP